MSRTATYSRRLPPTHGRRSLRLSDIFGLTVGAALLVALLMFIVPRFQQVQHEPTAAEIAAKIHRENLQARIARREGSILFVDPESCTDYAFDNWTGDVQYKSAVDCDERIAKMHTNDTEKSAERMRSVVEGFRR